MITSRDGNNRLFLGSPTGTFTERPDAGLQGKVAGPLAFADYDGDGDLDLFLGGDGESWLLTNTGAQLEDLGGPVASSAVMGVSWGDLDADGTPELYLASYRCTSCFPSGTPFHLMSLDELWEWTGLVWTDRSSALGDPLLRSGLAFIGAMEDWDDDGDVDIMVANDKGYAGAPPPGANLNRNAYFRNDGPGCGWWCLTEVAAQNGTDLRIDGMGIARLDIDADGAFDAVVTDNGPLALLKNQGDGTFVEDGAAVGMPQDTNTWGVVAGDFDNDGDEDLAVADENADWYLQANGGVFTETSDLVDARTTMGSPSATTTGTDASIW